MRDRRRRCQGTASVEAVVMLPFLVLLFAGALYVYRLGASHQQAMTEVRACAWARALAGCPRTLPSACLTPPQAKGTGEGEQRAMLAEQDGYSDFTEKLGFLSGFVERFLGETFASQRSAQVQALMDPEATVDVHGGLLLLCNPVPPDFGGILRELFTRRKKLAEGS